MTESRKLLGQQSRLEVDLLRVNILDRAYVGEEGLTFRRKVFLSDYCAALLNIACV
jgi:hypothetical protein